MNGEGDAISNSFLNFGLSEAFIWIIEISVEHKLPQAENLIQDPNTWSYTAIHGLALRSKSASVHWCGTTAHILWKG